jgi:hypothetical protein
MQAFCADDADIYGNEKRLQKDGVFYAPEPGVESTNIFGALFRFQYFETVY